jgi:hypothetical protein
MLQIFHVSDVCSESHGARLERWEKGRGETGVGRWGARRAWGPADGVCSSSFEHPGPARTVREKGGSGVSLGIRFSVRFWFGSSVFEEIRFLENRNRSVLKNSRNRPFRLLVISVRFRF